MSIYILIFFIVILIFITNGHKDLGANLQKKAERPNMQPINGHSGIIRLWDVQRACFREMTMTQFELGDVVKITMPRGTTKRGVDAIHSMYTTSQEAKCDGAVGTIIDIKPDGTHGIALYLVDFTKNENRWMPPYIRYWFRADFLMKQNPREDTSGVSVTAQHQTTTNPTN